MDNDQPQVKVEAVAPTGGVAGARLEDCGRPSHILSAKRFALILGLLILVSFPKVLAGLETFVVRDFGFFAYPAAHFQRQSFWSGELPLWNPYNNCGVPFLAQWNTMALYPPSLIYLLAPLSWSLSFFALAHLYLGGLGMFYLARRWSGSGLGGALAGLVFAFNGLSLNMLMWPSHIATLAWMPWVVFLVEGSWERRAGGRPLVWAALAGTLQMLAGGPETILMTWLLLAAWWSWRMIQQIRARGSPNAGSRSWQALLWRFPTVVLLVAALAAVQLLPFLDLVAHSQREQGYADTRWSMPGWGWANFLVPLVFGQVWNMGVFFQHEQAWTSSYYLGIGTALLAPLALTRWREPRVLFLGGAAALGFFLALGDQTIVFRWLRTLVPQMSFITYPIKYVTIVTFAAPLLAAFTVARLEMGERNSPLFRRVLTMAMLLLIFIVVILGWAWRFPFPTDNYSLTRVSGVSAAIFLLALVFLLRAFQRVGQEGWRRGVVCLGVLVIFWLDCFRHAPSQNPTVPPWVYEPGLARMKLAMQPQPELGVSRAMLTPFAAHKFTSFVSSSPRDNFLVKRLGYFANCNLLDAVPKVDGFFSLYPRECAEVNLLLYGSTNASYPRLEDFLATSQMTAPGGYTDWQTRRAPMPMVTAGQQPLFLDERRSLGMLASREWRPEAAVLLPASSEAEVKVRARSEARVISTSWRNHRVEVEAEGAEGFLVVVSQTYYHRWRAYVDGAPAKLLRANYGFQAVELGAGRHRVQLVYEDAGLKLGAWLSGAALVICVAWWGLGGRQRDL